MKVIKTLITCLCLIGMLTSTFAYTLEDASEGVSIYQEEIQSKLGKKIAQMDTLILFQLSELINTKLADLEIETNGEITTTTQKKIDLYIALQAVISSALLYDIITGVQSPVIEEDTVISDDIHITVYDDVRCSDCQTDIILEQLKQVPVLANATFEIKDFSDEGVLEYLQENQVTVLPAAIFSTNQVGSELAQYMDILDSGEYSLALGASHDPFIERSERGFRLLDKEILDSIISDAHIQGTADTEIMWIQYADAGGAEHFASKMLKDKTAEIILKEFSDDINMAYSNYIGVGGESAQKNAEILECVAEIGGADAYNSMIETIIQSKEYFGAQYEVLNLSKENGLDRGSVELCYENGETKNIVAKKFATGTEVFNITGTPGNVLINTKTREYEIVSGAYPAETFREATKALLQE